MTWRTGGRGPRVKKVDVRFTESELETLQVEIDAQEAHHWPQLTLSSYLRRAALEKASAAAADRQNAAAAVRQIAGESSDGSDGPPGKSSDASDRRRPTKQRARRGRS